MPAVPKWNFKHAALIVGAIALLLAFQLVARPLAYTGDEPRYIHMAASIFERGDLGISFEQWAQFAQRWNIPAYSPAGFVQPHSPVHAFLTAPIVGSLGPNAGRWVGFAVAMFAFLVTLGLIRKAADSSTGIGASLFVFSTIPLLAYSRSLYTEIWLAALFASAWYLLPLSRRGGVYKTLFVLLALSLPFFHLRMSLVSAGLILIAAAREFEDSAGQSRARATAKAAVVLGLAALAVGMLVAFQLWLTGSVRGTAGVPFEPTVLGFFERSAVQLLTVRHGLLVFNPVMICAATGLLLSASIGNRMAREGVLLCLLYLVTFVWGAASESAPARFWAAIMPIFAVGLALWLKSPKPWWASLVTLLLGLASVANAVLYLRDPNLFLENREVSLTYDKLFDFVPLFHFSHLLPWDKYFFLEQGFNPHYDESRALLAWASIAVLGLCVLLFLAVRFHDRKWVRRLSGLAVLALISHVLWSARACEVPRTNVLAKNAATSAPAGISSIIRFAGPIRPEVLRFVDSAGVWRETEYPDTFDVEYQMEDGRFERAGNVAAGRLVTLPPGGGTQAMRLTARGGADTDPRWRNGKISVLAKTCPKSLPAIWPPIPLGTRMTFEPGADGHLYLGAGWSHAEPWGVWSEGPRAQLILVTDQSADKDLRLEIEARALVTASYPKQDIEIRLNGMPATTVRLVRFEGNRFVVPIPSGARAAMSRLGELQVEFRFADAVRPKDVKINDDARKLALGIVALTLF